jgi:beta-lactamase superfamily II metal-dependent hydrolase
VLRFGQNHLSDEFGAPGWLATGDADLSGGRRRRAFQRYYRDVLDRVAVLVAPHHGAATSWHAELLNGLNMLRIGCAAAGPNSYGHPHASVKADIWAHPGAHFWQVDDHAHSVLTLEAWT